MIKVLIVDDSAVAREFLVHILGSDPQLEVVGTARDGEEAIEAAMRLKPDVITMDIHMPNRDGFEATLRIMETNPIPIVIVSGSSTVKEAATAFRAVEAGALAVISRPKGIGDPEYERTVRELIQTVKLMAEVKVVRRWPHLKKEQVTQTTAKEIKAALAEVKVVAIGASTGGPLVLQAILSRLPKEFPVPVLIVQHMAAGFVHGFAEWLAGSSALPVHVAVNNEPFLPGHAYLSPDGFHIGAGSGNRIMLSQSEPENGLRPSVSYLFRSVAQIFGKNAVGILLTGMGKDGAKELRLMKDKGAITIVQDMESSVVHGMPGEAISLGAATYVLSPGKIADVLISVTNGKGGVRL
ncbi:MAG: chemotaxis response regulator protein-glutamate methylesterase [Deltaproteobacteria bacterium]|jgi:two-component system chemotaxis response regulator CheB|nr:MAG: chemotaxis response regulator protein-glutamate methylesterase [Deltaproteobacteria bacterium]